MAARPSAEDLERFRAVSPIAHAHAVKAAMLFMLGAKDRRHSLAPPPSHLPAPCPAHYTMAHARVQRFLPACSTKALEKQVFSHLMITLQANKLCRRALKVHVAGGKGKLRGSG